MKPIIIYLDETQKNCSVIKITKKELEEIVYDAYSKGYNDGYEDCKNSYGYLDITTSPLTGKNTLSINNEIVGTPTYTVGDDVLRNLKERLFEHLTYHKEEE